MQTYKYNTNTIRNISSQLDIGIGIGYTLPTIGGNKSVGYNYWYWIYPIYIFCQWGENEEMERE